MRADLHIHSNYSGDSSVSVKAILRRALDLGLGAVSIVDHNSLSAWGEVRTSQELIVVPGVEVTCKEGHVLAYGITDVIQRDMSLEATVAAIHEAGGIAVAAHPYRLWSGVGERAVREGSFDAVETLNGRSLAGGNRRASHLALSLKLPQIGGSDAHSIGTIGRAVTVLPDDCRNADDILQAVLSGSCAVEGSGRRIGESFSYGLSSIRDWILRGMKRL